MFREMRRKKQIISFVFNLFTFTSALFPLYGFLNHETNAKTAIGAVIPKQVIIFHTANLIPSTISVTTSFLAVYLTFRRSAFYAIGYAANDIVLIILWVLATISDISYLSVAICFVVFLVNDIYGFINWSRMQKRQENDCIVVVNNTISFWQFLLLLFLSYAQQTVPSCIKGSILLQFLDSCFQCYLLDDI